MDNKKPAIKIYSPDSPSLNIPQTDPNWDYAQIWEQVNCAKGELEELINYLASVEEADLESNSRAYTMLGYPIDRCKHCRKLINSSCKTGENN